VCTKEDSAAIGTIFLGMGFHLGFYLSPEALLPIPKRE